MMPSPRPCSPALVMSSASPPLYSLRALPLTGEHTSRSPHAGDLWDASRCPDRRTFFVDYFVSPASVVCFITLRHPPNANAII